jgi:hypothetical protein
LEGGGWIIGADSSATEIKDDDVTLDININPIPIESLFKENSMTLLLREDKETLTQTHTRADRMFEKMLQILSDDKASSCVLLARFISLDIVLRAKCRSEDVLALSLLTSGIPSPPPIGDFSESFPDVADLAKHLQALPLKDLQTFFHGEMSRSGEKIELPGVKLPAQGITSWGIIIVLALEGYFFVVFRELSGRITSGDKAWDVPWIGISSDNVSRAAFVASMLMVLIAVGYLSWNGVKSTSNIWVIVLYGMGFMGSVAFVVAILRRRAFVSVKKKGYLDW